VTANRPPNRQETQGAVSRAQLQARNRPRQPFHAAQEGARGDIRGRSDLPARRYPDSGCAARLSRFLPLNLGRPQGRPSSLLGERSVVGAQFGKSRRHTVR